MEDVRFYHVMRSGLLSVVPVLLEKAYRAGFRVLVHLDEDDVDTWDEHLWTYKEESFLPHERVKEQNPPILLASDTSLSGAYDLVFRLALPFWPFPPEAERVFLVFEDNNEQAVRAARGVWENLSSQGTQTGLLEGTQGGYSCTYWQQDQRGKWNEH